MKKTGYEIIGMIKDGKAPKVIKNDYYAFEYKESNNTYQTKDMSCINLIHCLNEEFEIIEEDKVWKPEYYGEYWFIDSFGKVIKDKWEYTFVDEIRYDLGNCFKTEEEVKQAKEKMLIYMQLKRYAEEHNTEKIDWKNKRQTKWFICYDFEDNEIITFHSEEVKDIGLIYFTSEEICWKAIKEIGEDNIKKLFEE